MLSAVGVVRGSTGLRIGFLRCGLLRRRGLRSGRAGRGAVDAVGAVARGTAAAVRSVGLKPQVVHGGRACWALGAGAVRVGGCAAGFGAACRAGDGADDERGVGERPEVDGRASSEADGEPDGAEVGADVGADVGEDSADIGKGLGDDVGRAATSGVGASCALAASATPPVAPAASRTSATALAAISRDTNDRRAVGGRRGGAVSVPAVAKAARAAASPAISSARPGAAAAARSQVTGVSGPWPSSNCSAIGPVSRVP